MPTTRAFRRYSTQTLDQLIPAPFGFESFQMPNSATLGPLLPWSMLTGSFTVIANTAVAVSDTMGSVIARAEVELATDHWASVACASEAPRGIGVALACHPGAELTCYLAYQQDLQWAIGRFNNGGWTGLAASLYVGHAPPVQQGDIIRAVKRGSRVLVWHNDRLALSVIDPTPLPYTRAGMFGRVGAAISQFYCGVGESAGPWGGGIVTPPTVTVSTREPYFGVLEPDEVSLTLANDGWTPDQVLNLRGRPITVESWDALDVAPPWRAHFYSGTGIAGDPIAIREYPRVDFPLDWVPGPPMTVPWSVRLWTMARFHEGETIFRLEHDDGARLYVDGALVIDQWIGGGYVATGSYWTRAGWHSLELQFYQQAGAGYLRLSWTPVWSRRQEAYTGVVTTPSMNLATITLRCASLNPADLETQIPKGPITATAFPLAVDVGKTPAVPFGIATRVPMVYVHRDLETSVYRYACRRTFAVVNVYRGWQENLFYVEPTEYTVSYAVYPGYTTLIFPKQQVDVSGGDNAIYADLAGEAWDRNPIEVMRQILIDPTWGLGKTINQASFDLAFWWIGTYFGGLWADGYIQEPRAARDYLRQLMMYRGIRLWVNGLGEYEIAVDTPQDLVVMTLQDGAGEGDQNILAISDVEGTPLLDMVQKYILRYRRNGQTGYFVGTHARLALSEGQEWTEENIFVDAHETADRILDFLAKTHISGDKRVTVTVGPEGHLVRARELVSLTHQVGFADARMRVVKVTKAVDTELDLRGTSTLDYVYTPGTLPADGFPHSSADFSRVVPANVTGLSIVVADSGVETGVDDNMVAYHILEFTTPTGGTPPAQAYHKARIDVKRDGDPFYHTGYATDMGLGLRRVKISGLLPGVGYTHLVVPVTSFDVPGSGVSVSGLTPGSLVMPSQVTSAFVVSSGAELSNDGTQMGYHNLRFTTPSGSSINDTLYASARIDVRQVGQSDWHTGYGVTDQTGEVTIKIGNLVPTGTYEYRIVSLTRLGVPSAGVVVGPVAVVANLIVPTQVVVTGWTHGIDSQADDGPTTAYQIIHFTAPLLTTTPSDIVYAYCRIDYKEQGQATYHQGYAEITGRGAQQVKVSGLIPGRLYDYELVSISTVGTPSPPVYFAPNTLTPGDTIGPGTQGTPSILSQHLREFLFAVSCTSEPDLKTIEYDIRTASAGGGTPIATGTAPAIRGGQTTIAYTLPASVGYGSTRYIRARGIDNTGNPSQFWSAALPFAAARTITDDYGLSTVATQTIINRAVDALRRVEMTSVAGVYGGLAPVGQPGYVTGAANVAHGMGQIPSIFIDTSLVEVMWHVWDVTSTGAGYVLWNEATYPVGPATAVAYYR